MGGKKGAGKALIVEDAQIARMALQMMLEELDCQVVAVSSGHEAVEKFDATFDVIFMDYNMPGMNGDKATEMIRQKEKNLSMKKPTYIVGLSANNIEDIEQVCLASGMNQMIEKPIQPEILKELLQVLTLQN